VPNGVASGLPPAFGTPLRAVWHTAQLPSAASSLPRATRSGANALASGGVIGVMACGASDSAPSQPAAPAASAPRKPLRQRFFVRAAASSA
jgi:hypothetical protein